MFLKQTKTFQKTFHVHFLGVGNIKVAPSSGPKLVWRREVAWWRPSSLVEMEVEPCILEILVLRFILCWMGIWWMLQMGWNHQLIPLGRCYIFGILLVTVGNEGYRDPLLTKKCNNPKCHWHPGSRSTPSHIYFAGWRLQVLWTTPGLVSLIRAYSAAKKTRKVQGGTREARDMSAQTQQPGESSSNLSPSWSVLKGLPMNQPPFDTFCFFSIEILTIFSVDKISATLNFETCVEHLVVRLVRGVCGQHITRLVTGRRCNRLGISKSFFSIKSSKTSRTSWWFQPLWKILVKMGIFPK